MARRRKQAEEAPAREPTFETLEDLEQHGLPAASEARSVPKHIRDRARDYTAEATAFYAKYARDTSQPVHIRKACYDELMNRAWGRPRDEGDLKFDGVVEVRFVKKDAPHVIDVVAQSVSEIAEERPRLLDAMRTESAAEALGSGAIVPIEPVPVAEPSPPSAPPPPDRGRDDS